MPKTVKSVAQGYTVNTNYCLNPRQLESIIKVLKTSKDNLSKAHACHIVMQIDKLDFDKTIINKTLIQALQVNMSTAFGFYTALEKSADSGYHIHIMLTFSTGLNYPFTIVSAAVDALYAINEGRPCIAIPRKIEGQLPYYIINYYSQFKTMKKKYQYCHNLNIELEFKDAIHRFSYLSKTETKDELKGNRLTQPKYPSPNKTKQAQTIRKNKISEQV